MPLPEPRRWDGTGLRVGGPRPLLMGIVNVTPDSFSDGGRHDTTEAAVRHGVRLAEEGADILDTGGESTRPGSHPVTERVELQRTVDVVRRLCREVDIPVSIDTTKSRVAEACVEAGATIINDISGLTFDPQMPSAAAAAGVGVVCMHTLGRPATMQDEIRYPADDVVTAVVDSLSDRLRQLTDAGIPADRVVLDPGIGFGKTARHNVALLQAIPRLREIGRPLLIGHSRKRFIGKILGRDVDERLAGTIGVTIAAAAAGAELIRVHDVAANRDALDAFFAVSPSPGNS